MNGAIDTRLILTPEQAAELLGLSRHGATLLMETGRLRSEVVGRGQRKHRRTCRAWIEEYRNGGRETGETTGRPSPVVGLQYQNLGRGAKRGADIR